MLEIRQYQTDAIDSLTTEAEVNGHRRLLLQAPTGSGKTCISSRIIQHATKNKMRTLFLCHRRELVHQTIDKLRQLDIEPGVIMADEPYDSAALVQVASIQSLHSHAIRRAKIDFPSADLVVIDESHHLSSSNSWQRILHEYPESLILGMTATPINKRGMGLGNFFDAMVKCPTIQSLIDQNFLVKPKYYIPSLPDLKGVHVRMGDYVESELEVRMDQPKLVGDIIQNWVKIAPDRKTMIFATSIKHSIHISESFKAIGIKAEHVDGDFQSKERDRITQEFRHGDLQVLVNCAVYTEGADFPQASCLVFARPTKSLVMYLQVGGRVLRPFPGKENAIVIDHSGVYWEHGPIEQDWDWQLDYGKASISELMAKKVKEKKKRQILCESCKMVYEGQINCPQCGAIPKRGGKEVPTLEAWLQEADAEETKSVPKADQQEWYRMFLGYAKEKGKKEGFAYLKQIEKFGIKPPWSWKVLEPLTPSLEVKSWIRSRQIAWARSRRNPANQTLTNPEPSAKL